MKATATIIILIFSTLPSLLWSADTLYLQLYIDQVMRNHPLIEKANLNDEIQAASELKGRGALDPKIKSDYNTKDFKDTDYFNIWDTKATIPTRLPVDFSVGYERNNGDFLNAERTVPDRGLVYGTINLSVLRGLLFDQTRFDIQNAELKGVKSQIDRDIMIREVLFQAINTYLDWSRSYYQIELQTNFLDLINERHLNIVQLYVNGDKPSIDTLESRLNINTAEKFLLDAQADFVKTSQQLNLFLWDEDGSPLIINDGIYPESLQELTKDLYEIALLSNPVFEEDPFIRKVDNSIDMLSLENRLTREQLKPQLDLKYNTLLNLADAGSDPSFSLNDYKYGITFMMPILNRKTRGDVRLNEAIIDQNILDRTNYLYTLQTKYDAILNRYDIQSDQLLTIEEKIRNSTTLYEAEVMKFGIGESSIFLLNSRERKILEANIDLITTTWKLGRLINELYYIRLGQGQ